MTAVLDFEKPILEIQEKIHGRNGEVVSQKIIEKNFILI